MTLASMNYVVTFALASFVVGSGFCRIAQVDMKQAQYRYVAPFVLFFVWGSGVAISLIGGDRVDWFQPIGLLAISIYFWNTRGDWSEGMPAHYMREGRLQMAPDREVAVRKLTLENAGIGAFVALSVGVAGVGATEGRGDPLQIYSVYVSPPVATAGSPIEIKQTFRRVRVCPGYATRFIMDADTGQAVQSFAPTPMGATAVGRKMVDATVVTLQLSPDLKPGRYFYKSIIYSACDDANYTKEVGPAPFVISPATQAN